MVNQVHLDILKQGVEVWNKWRKDHQEVVPDLSGVDLSKAQLCDANLNGANLSRVNFSGADLSDADLSNSDLRGADLSGAIPFRAIMSGADLRDADLKEAHLLRAILYEVDARKANLREATLVETDLRSANFSGADLSKADLNHSDLRVAILKETNLIDADLSNAWIMRSNLSGANLSEAKLAEANLSRAILRNVNCSKVDLNDADLSEADLRGANLSKADLCGTILRGANLEEADFSEANLSKADLRKANLTKCRIYAVSAWDIQLEETTQSGMIITPIEEPTTITVDNLEVAQFIYLLLNNQRIRHVIDTITSKVVLILGRFTEDRKKVLDALREELRLLDFTPVLFDFERPANRDFTETVRTLAHLSRFIIADITEPSSIPQELQTIVPELEVPVQPILEEGKKQYSMFPDLRKHPWVFPVYLYKDQADLIASLKNEIIEPASKKARELAVEKAKRLERS